MSKHKKICAFLLMVSSVLQAQSYHFSQFFSTPLLTNPAHTGLIDGQYRVAANLRSQGKAAPSAFFTGYVSADARLLQNHLPAGYKAGAGIFVMTDRSLRGASQTNSLGVSAAYHVGLDEFDEQTLGLGFQATYNQRQIDFNRLSFGNQFGNDGYDAALPTGENLNNTNRTYFDLNAGLMYNANFEDKSFFFGGSVYNILRQKNNIIKEEYKMPTRYVLQGGGQVFAGEYGKVYFSLTHMRQAAANETTAGGAFGLQLAKGDTKNEVSFGMWYRYKDALIPYLGYYYGGFQVGLSYDYTVSQLKTASEVRNAYELTLIYRGADKAGLKTVIPWY
jgi:type IX secretion system PorP/SprF family membrane protein